jgi:hypothetical protein
MYPTAEVRWFFRGTIAPAVAAWFRRSEQVLEEELPRVDHYLRQVGTDSLNIKLREGRLEVKQRQQAGTVVQFHPRVAGRVERWRKWSFELAEAAGPGLQPEIMTPHWIAVEKRRTLRRYRLEGERVVRVLPAELPEQGCDLELTRIRAGREAWWSLGLEAYGADPYLESLLVQVAGRLMARTEPPSLATENSYGYPEWLGQLEG